MERSMTTNTNLSKLSNRQKTSLWASLANAGVLCTYLAVAISALV